MDYTDLNSTQIKSEPPPDAGEHTPHTNTPFSNMHNIQPLSTDMLNVKIKTEKSDAEFFESAAYKVACSAPSTDSHASQYPPIDCKALNNVKTEATASPVRSTTSDNGVATNVTALQEGRHPEDPAGTYDCPYCDLEATQPRFLRLHMRLAHNPNGEAFKCDTCGYETRDRRVLNKHIRNRHKLRAKGGGEKAREGDGESRSEEEEEEDEEDEEEDDDEGRVEGLGLVDQKDSDYYQCPYCSFETTNTQALTRHRQYAHKENGDLFRCEQCQYESIDRRKLTRHIRIRHRDEVLSCERCDYQTRDRASLAAHLAARHADLAAPLPCRFCPFTTADHTELREHVATRHVERTERSLFTCEECGLQTPNAAYMRSHVRAKHGDGGTEEPEGGEDAGAGGGAGEGGAAGGGGGGEDELLTCPHCPYDTRDPAYLEQHVRAKHGRSLKPHVCDQCGYTARLKKQMNRHVRFRHDDTTAQYRCHLCQMTTKDKYYFEKHYKYVHGEVLDVFKCPECPFQTKYKQHLGRHVRLNHTNEGAVYRCQLCPYASRNKGNYTDHFKHMHDETAELFRCEECDYKAKKRRTLRLHVASVHSSQPPCHPCPHCDFTSRSPKYLAQHVQMKHSHPDLRYTCQHCPYATPYKSYLGKHVRRCHTDGPMIPCELCPYQAKHKETLTHHMRRKHARLAPPPSAGRAAAARARAEARAAVKGAQGELREAGDACPHCPFRSHDTHKLRQHVKLRHEETAADVYECAVCLFVTRNKSYLKEHYRREHEQAEQYRCTQCNFVTKNQNYYKKHVKVKHAAEREVWLCAFCSVESFYKNGIKKHMWNVHKDQFEDFKTEEKRKAHLEVLVANALVTRRMEEQEEEEAESQPAQHDAKIDIKEEDFGDLSDYSDEKNTEELRYGSATGGDRSCGELIGGFKGSSGIDGNLINGYKQEQMPYSAHTDCDQSLTGYSGIDGNRHANNVPGYQVNENSYDHIGKSYNSMHHIDDNASKNHAHNRHEVNIDSKDHLHAVLIKEEDRMNVDQAEYVSIGSSYQASVVGEVLEDTKPGPVKMEVNYDNDVDS